MKDETEQVHQDTNELDEAKGLDRRQLLRRSVVLTIALASAPIVYFGANALAPKAPDRYPTASNEPVAYDNVEIDQHFGSKITKMRPLISVRQADGSEKRVPDMSKQEVDGLVFQMSGVRLNNDGKPSLNGPAGIQSSYVFVPANNEAVFTAYKSETLPHFNGGNEDIYKLVATPIGGVEFAFPNDAHQETVITESAMQLNSILKYKLQQ